MPKEKLGYSDSLIGDRGCALMCISMVLKYYGVNTEPSNFISKKGLINLGNSFNNPVIGKEYIKLKASNNNVEVVFVEKIDGNISNVGITFKEKNGRILSADEKVAVKLVKSGGLWYLEDKGIWYYPK